MKGDVLKTLGINGSDIRLSSGIVQVTTKRTTAVLYSLFATNWVGNMFVEGDARMESSFQELHSATMTLDNLLNIGSAAEQSLDWLVRKGDIQKVEAATSVLDGGFIVTEIEFTELDDTVTYIEVWKHPQYWEVRGAE